MTLLEALGNPLESSIDAYLTVAQYLGVKLSALVALL